ncbi:MAG: hypothetical protein R3B06_11290 [Kofleriaceae bacterium]
MRAAGRGAAGLALVAIATGCAGHAVVAGRLAPGAAQLTIYRDGATVEERLTIALDADGVGEAPLPAGIDGADLDVISDDGAIVGWSVGPGDAPAQVLAGAAATPGRVVRRAPDGWLTVATADGLVLAPSGRVAQPGPRLRIRARAGAGAASVVVRYPTSAIAWQVAYTLIDDGDGHGRLSAALTIDNQSGRRWPRAAITVLDRSRPRALAGADEPTARLRLPGPVRLEPGVQRVDAGVGRRRLRLRPTLVYDPVGDRLDTDGPRHNDDPRYGVAAWSSDLAASIAIDLAELGRRPVPAGPVRLFAVDPTGALVWRGQGTLLPLSEGAEQVATIEVGTTADVSGRRTQGMFEVDRGRARLFEEIRLTFTNRGDRPAEVVAREHLYRGRCWRIVYYSTPDIAKLGEQQVRLRTTVPAHGHTLVVYRVAYFWSQEQCGH